MQPALQQSIGELRGETHEVIGDQHSLTSVELIFPPSEAKHGLRQVSEEFVVQVICHVGGPTEPRQDHPRRIAAEFAVAERLTDRLQVLIAQRKPTIAES